MRKKILLVEDSVSFAALLEDSIAQAHGFPTDTTKSLAETTALLQANAQDYFVAIVDYHLPDAPDGEAIDVVKEFNIPVVVFTASNDRGLKEDLWNKGIADYANKHGTYNVEYVVWLIKRIYKNYGTEVLIVDDSRVARKNLERLLRTQRFNVYVADSGIEALEILQIHPDISLAIIDCHMQEMSGFEVTAKIRETHSSERLEIIGVSSEGGRRLSAQFIKSGANDFILKPFLPEELLCRVNKSIDRIESFAELKQLNNTKNQFLSTAAHDIRGPLAAIKTAADFLQRGTNPEREHRLVELIQTNSSGLIQLLETLLDISIIESGALQLNKELVDISQLIIERIELYEAEANTKNISMEAEIAENIRAVVDPIKIRQLVDNLITNAIKYSYQDKTIRIAVNAQSGRWRLVIQDAGPGISHAEQQKLFIPFTKIATKTTGGERKIGLGLAIAKSVVDAHEGTIHYFHDDIRHSTFTVEIPLQSKTEKPG